MGCVFRKVRVSGTQPASPTSPKTSSHRVQKRAHELSTSEVVSPRQVNPSHSPSSNENPNRKPTPSTDNLINILLLGESGVGKSTFINALANYLTFRTFEQAHFNKPKILLPVSFLLTVGDNFEERIITLGEKDSNEVHNQLGQSVTQQCRSYYLSDSTQTRIQLIDTPGVGDTRGLEQDDLNIKNILSYIKNLPHLNAICILLKPNESRLNVVFRSCIIQLMNCLGENAGENLVFCFTNTRATFFTPGNTAPLLKQMLENLPMKNLPFGKSNTFCFDSESFRYLIARENGIEFDEYQKKEYEQSWIRSVEESNRFLLYITQQLKQYKRSIH